MIDNFKLFNNNFSTDNRGKFIRIFCQKENLLTKNDTIKQINLSENPKKYTLRGMHYQTGKYAEGKYFHVIQGELQLIVVDIRKESKTYKNIENITLNYKSCSTVFIPIGCANGFLTLKNDTKVIYAMTQFYNEKYSKGFSYKSNLIQNLWLNNPKIISAKDKRLKSL